MADITRQEFAAALRSIANSINALATSFDDTPVDPIVLVTETGQRFQVVQVLTSHLVAEPATAPTDPE